MARYAFIDKANNIIHTIANSNNLQAEFELFVKKVQEQGRMGLCVGEVHLVLMVDMCPSSLLHLERPVVNERPSGWKVKLDSLPPLDA